MRSTCGSSCAAVSTLTLMYVIHWDGVTTILMVALGAGGGCGEDRVG